MNNERINRFIELIRVLCAGVLIFFSPVPHFRNCEQVVVVLCYGILLIFRQRMRQIQSNRKRIEQTSMCHKTNRNA